MKSLMELRLKTAVEKTCKDKPCLWSFSVKRVKERKGIDLGIKAGKNRRPGITTGNQYIYRIVFLTTKNNGQPKVDLSYCRKKEKLCSEVEWVNYPRVFITKSGKRVFRFPKEDFLDAEKPLAEFCSDCDREIFYSLKEVLPNEP